MSVTTVRNAPAARVAGLLGACLIACLGLGSGCGWKLETREAPSALGQAADGGPADAGARAVAAAFSLPNDDGSHVSLDDLLAEGRPAVLVFYRGHW
ncbi:redoxin domain-containing protein [Enhygromyxa salina]|uniref:Uncharacterized protein n=1 Tax=Enhygromyxa salina TaxID=215803 RepID=A0A2S9YRD7_9BACT|nr:hypothetical protein ENSA7_26120 [Enhygromyxa salina]